MVYRIGYKQILHVFYRFFVLKVLLQSGCRGLLQSHPEVPQGFYISARARLRTTTGNIHCQVSLHFISQHFHLTHWCTTAELPSPTDDLLGVCGYLKVNREKQGFKSRAVTMWMTGSQGELQYGSRGNGCWGGTTPMETMHHMCKTSLMTIKKIIELLQYTIADIT